jgi:putative ABC transport system permease protein
MATAAKLPVAEVVPTMPALAARRGSVPVAWRQLRAEPAKVAVSVLAIAAAVALVLLLTGLRRGMGDQVTLYLDRQPPVLVGQAGARNFIGQTSVLPETLGERLERVPGVAAATPISSQFAMLTLHGRRVLLLLVGFDPGRAGGPWSLAAGRAPRARDEIMVDRVLAGEHGLAVGSIVEHRGTPLRVVGLSRGTTAWMTPLAFATRATLNALGRQPGTATFFLVRPREGVSPAALGERIERAVSGVSALTREEAAVNDRSLFTGAFNGVLLAMVTIAFAVAITVIGLTVYSSASERGREYATLKAIGLRRGPLLRLAGAQAGALALAGTALGTVLAFATVRVADSLAPKYLIVVSAQTVMGIALAALAMALAAAFLPARHLARLDPATAFRR